MIFNDSGELMVVTREIVLYHRKSSYGKHCDRHQYPHIGYCFEID